MLCQPHPLSGFSFNLPRNFWIASPPRNPAACYAVWLFQHNIARLSPSSQPSSLSVLKTYCTVSLNRPTSTRWPQALLQFLMILSLCIKFLCVCFILISKSKLPSRVLKFSLPILQYLFLNFTPDWYVFLSYILLMYVGTEFLQKSE